ncbi:MAG: hypothetical protein HQK76_15210 [Desulfobacterales bacterium]|nr:hypothetical protein [Desulfobacterales bacterium]
MKKKIGTQLITSLTTKELSELIDAIFSFLNSDQIEKILSDIQEDISSVISELLHPEKKSEKKEVQPLSSGKFNEEWQALWKKWRDIVQGLGDEDGKYVYQENNWDSPYFNSDQFAEDLDNVAEEILPMLEKVWEMHMEEDILFHEALSEIEDGINSYPEWMGPAEDVDCFVGSIVTSCILEWTWLISNKNSDKFLSQLITLEEDLQFLRLDQRAYENFFANLTDDEKKCIYQYLKDHENAPAWKELLIDAHSKWHKIYYDYTKTFSPETYFRISYNLLDQNWTYGVDLIHNQLKKNNLKEAEALYQKTLISFAGKNQDKEVWDPGKKLLILSGYRVGKSSDERIVNLLGEWQNICKEIGLESKSKILIFQQAVYQTRYDWDKIFSLIQNIKNPEISPLIEQWKMYNISESISYMGRYIDESELISSWINWLIDAAMDETKGKAYFVEKTRTWFKGLSRENKLSIIDQLLVNIFTNDIGHISEFKLRYPNLLQLISAYRDNNPVSNSRSKWLKEMGGLSFIPDITDLWIIRILDVMPDPRSVQDGQYHSHALWVAALKELDPDKFQEVIKKWQIDYKRRKNLWAEIQRIGVKIP